MGFALGRKSRVAILATAASVMLLFSAVTALAVSFDEDVTPDFFAGSGNDNGAFTVEQADGVELGLRAKLRFDGACTPQNIFNSNGDGTYSFDAVDRIGCASWADGDTPEWNFEWAVNTDHDDSSGLVLDDLTYELGMDADPSLGTSFLAFDPINVPFADHTIGDNTSTDGFNEFVAADAPGYAALISSFNVAQQSWNYDFFDSGAPLDAFDAESPGVYDIYLAAYSGGDEVASVTIQVVVGEPTCAIGPNPVEVGGTYSVITGDGIEDATAPSDAGIYSISPVCDDLVVYDPAAGFVTGGGWIDSPAGALKNSVLVWDQDFEAGDDGWFDGDDAWFGTISDNGDGTAQFEGDASSAPFSRFDGYRDVWTGSWTAEIDVYLDPAWAAGQGFDYSVASNGSDGNHQRDFIFHVTKDTSTGALLVAGSNNTNFAPREDLDTLANHYEVTTAGWYTLQHVFRDAGGHLAVDLNLLDDGGIVLFTETREDVSDTIPAEVGGNRYSWFTVIDIAGGIQVDNHQLFIADLVEGKANFGFVSQYNGDTVPTGSVQFGNNEADLNFHSNSQDWLVLVDNTAIVQGTGTVNGEGEYKFKLWVTDGKGTPGPDTFRIRIWSEDGGVETVLYDNGSDQEPGGGQIVVHKPKGKGKKK